MASCAFNSFLSFICIIAGNPQEMPLKRMVELFHKHIDPQHIAWFAYNMGPPKDGIDAILNQLQERVNIQFDPKDMIYCRCFPSPSQAYRIN